MSRRTETGAVAGGLGQREFPPGLDVGDWPLHAKGRLDSMAEITVNAMFLKAKGVAGFASGYHGAKFQDYFGDRETMHRMVAAHRALFALHVDGVNMAYLPHVAARPNFSRRLAAPQARTDMIPEPANYADSRLESACNDQVFHCLRLAVEQQPKNKPLDKLLALKTIAKTRELIIQGFDGARVRFFELQAGRGEEFLGPGGLRHSLTDSDIADWDANFESSASHFQSNRPTQFRILVELAIDLGQAETQAAEATLSKALELDQHVAQLEALAT